MREPEEITNQLKQFAAQNSVGLLTNGTASGNYLVANSIPGGITYTSDSLGL